MEVIWGSNSCCGGHRNGTVVFPDGEVLHVNESESGYAVRAVKGDRIHVDSDRVKGGEAAGLTAEEFAALLAG